MLLLCELDELPGEIFQLLTSQSEAGVHFTDRGSGRFKVCRDGCGQVLRPFLHIRQGFASRSCFCCYDVESGVDFIPCSHRSCTQGNDRSGDVFRQTFSDVCDALADFFHLFARCFELLGRNGSELFVLIGETIKLLGRFFDLTPQSSLLLERFFCLRTGLKLSERCLLLFELCLCGVDLIREIGLFLCQQFSRSGVELQQPLGVFQRRLVFPYGFIYTRQGLFQASGIAVDLNRDAFDSACHFALLS